MGITPATMLYFWGVFEGGIFVHKLFLALLSALSLVLTGCTAQKPSAVEVPTPPVTLTASNYYQSFTNNHAGFTLSYPTEMQADQSLAAVRTLLRSEQAEVEIFVERKTPAMTYINYSNAPILTGRDKVQVIRHSQGIQRGRAVHELWWQRPALREVTPDKTFYASIDIIVERSLTYTLLFQAKTLAELERIVPVMTHYFMPVPATGEAPAVVLPRAASRAATLSTEAAALLEKLATTSQQTWGLFEPSFPLYAAPLHRLESRLDYFFEYILLYSDFTSGMPGNRLMLTAKEGRIPVLTLQTFSPALGVTYSLTYDLLSGKHDEWLRQYARDVAKFGQPLLFRFNNEMNGDWCAYSAYWSSKDASLYIASYRYLYRLFAEEGANNVLWVWNPHDGSYPPFAWNDKLLYYPGDAYVDIVGLTGYNAGTYYPGEEWRGFREIYDPLYASYDALFPHKPLIITEFASNSVGGDKVAWIKEAMENLPRYPRISVAIWWNHADFHGIIPARRYWLDETPETLAAFKDGLRNFR